jgi:hypothetical protein
MTIKVSGVPFNDIVPEIKEALDTALAGTLGQQQADLSAANPKDTGRMASSWQIGYNAPARPADRGEGWVKPNESKPKVEILEYTQKITFKGEWYISNAAPYADFIAYNYPPSATKAQKDWFTAIANQTGNVFNKQFNKVKP